MKLLILNKIDNRKIQKMCLLGIIVSSLCSLWCAFLALYQAPGIGDESYYWYLISNQSTASLTWFNKYWSFAKDWDLVQLRILGYCIQIASGIIFSTSIILSSKKFLQYKYSLFEIISIIMLGACSVFLIRPHESLLPNYARMNLYISCIGLSFLLFGLYIFNNKIIQAFCIIISGVIFSQLIFVMPTTCITVIYLIIILFFSTQKIRTIWYLLGITFGIILFFIFVFDIRSWLEGFVYSVSIVSTGHASNHSSKDILHWLFKTYKIMCFYVMLPAFSLYVIMKKSNTEKIKILFYIILNSLIIVSGIICYFSNITREGCFDIYVPMIISMGIVYYVIFTNEKCLRLNQILFLILPIVLPVMLSIGTDVEFTIRGQVYVIFPLIFSIIYAFAKKNITILIECTLLIIIGGIMGVKQIKAGNSQTMEKLYNSTLPLKEYNCSAKVSEARYKMYIQANKILHNKSYIGGGPYIWHFVKILNKKPLSLSFKCKLDAKSLNICASDLALILENKNNMTDIEYKELLKLLNAEKYIINEIPGYLIITFEDKLNKP